MKHLLKSIFMKAESVYGTNSAPTTDNTILAENVEIDPLVTQTDDVGSVSSKFGLDEKIIGTAWCSVRFDVLVCGGGTPIGTIGALPNHDVVLRAGCMSRVINTGVDIQYLPIDTGEESASLVYYVDTAKFVLLGLRGDLEWVFEIGKAPRLRFTGMGLRTQMTDESAPAYSLPTRPRPVAMSVYNTLITLGSSYPLRCSSMNIKLGNKIDYIDRPHQQVVALSDRQSSGTITFELPSVATQDFLGASGLCTRATTTSLLTQFGSVAGNRVSWLLPAMQLLNPRLVGDKGRSMLTCDLHPLKNQLAIAYF